MPSPKRISKIEYSLLSPQEIRNMSVRKILWAETYDDRGYPIPQGLMDPNLGVVTQGFRCKTCDNSIGNCSGHFGHIDLTLPVIHVGYVNLIKKFLESTCRKCGKFLGYSKFNKDFDLKELYIDLVFLCRVTCWKCGALLINAPVTELRDWSDAEDVKNKGEKEKRIIRKFIIQALLCRICGEEQYKINFYDPNVLSQYFPSDEEKERFLSNNDILNWINRISPKDFDYLDIDRTVLINFLNTSQDENCVSCGETQYNIIFKEPFDFIELSKKPEEQRNYRWRRREKKKLNPVEIQDRLAKITDEDLNLMGFNNSPDFRPEWMVLTVLPVPPVYLRPPYIDKEQFGDYQCEDDLTLQLSEIIRTNQRLNENLNQGAPTHIIEDIWALLQQHIASYFNNELSNIPPAKHPIQGPFDLLFDTIPLNLKIQNKYEQALFDFQNLDDFDFPKEYTEFNEPKRDLELLSQKIKLLLRQMKNKNVGTPFSVCSIIVPNPSIPIQEIGIPKKFIDNFGKDLTKHLFVSIYNKDEIKSHIRVNSDCLDDPSSILIETLHRPDKKYIRFSGLSNEMKVEKINQIDNGWIIQRKIRNGDYVICNKKPSFSKLNMLSFQIKIIEGNSIQINPIHCLTFNLRFDGELVDVYFPQSFESLADTQLIMNIKENLLSPRCGGPIIGATKEAILGIFILTNGLRWYSKDDTLHILGSVCPENLPLSNKIENEKEFWSNKQILSMIIKESLNIIYQAQFCKKCTVCQQEKCMFDAYVNIQNGKLMCGTLDRNGIAPINGEIIKKYFFEFGKEKGIQFVQDLFYLGTRVLTQSGYSKGIENYSFYKYIEETPNKRSIKVNDRRRQIKKNPKKMNENWFKRNNDIFDYFEKRNPEQQFNRFIQNTYEKGLDPIEFFIDAMDHRIDLLNDDFNKQEREKLYRRLSDSLMNLALSRDGTVRIPNGKIVQFTFGEDRTDPSKTIDGNPVNVKSIIEEQLERDKFNAEYL